MVKLTGPLFSAEAHKALGKALTYQRRPGGASVYGYKKPKVPLTDRQQWQRNLIKWCVYEWQQLSAGAKAEWEAKAQGQGQSGYSYFIKQRRGYLFDPDVVLYLPLYDARLSGSSFLSMDSHGHLVTVTGAEWRSTGRYFDGLDDYINLGDPASLSAATSGTVELWGSSDAISQTFFSFSKPSTSFLDELRLETSTGGLIRWILYQSGVTFSLASPASSWSHDVLHHLVVTSDSSTVKMYIDGVEVTVTEVTGTNTGQWMASANIDADTFTLGGIRRSAGLIQDLKGTIGEVRIYDRALTPLEVEHNYLATKWRY